MKGVSLLLNAVIFDVDDTLYDQQQPFRNAVTTIIPEVALTDLHSLYIRFRVHSDDHFSKVISQEWTLEEFRTFRLCQSLIDLGYSPLSAEASRLFQTTYEAELDNIQLHPAVKETLNLLASLPIKLGIITNGPTDHQQKKINQLELTRWIDPNNMLISQATGYQKPDIELFQLAEEQFDLDPAQTLYVGDNFDNDVLGSKQAGWQALWLNHRNRLAAVEDCLPDCTLTAFEDLTEGILSLNHKVMVH
jgi:putative hydrolase of the HAD superfamily